SGGVAADKAAELARALIRDGHEVTVVMTRGAQEFIRPLTFASLTGRKVITDLFSAGSPEETLSSSIEHISVAREHDLLLVAPATADVLARFAHGLADDFLSTLYLAFSGPVVLAPAMNDKMWDHAATRTNLEILRARGHVVADPSSGYLACGTYGEGRLAELESILSAVENACQGDLAGETILITAGPTREPIDPVRFLSNRSSGRMGYALAAAAKARGATVVLVTGPTALEAPAGCEVIRIETAAEMFAQVLARFEAATVIIMSAAVADYRPAVSANRKIKKSTAGLMLELEPTADILASVGKRKSGRILIGFAAETDALESSARRKLENKNCDMIVGNLVGPDKGFDRPENEVLLVLRSGESVVVPMAPKSEIAHRILDEIGKLK
ncbi:MAG: bifunctional phosphopantothenoylcysteine decarboxylase/phosphopantothenate--cysteine ligase CoaBC, partial [Terriglobia bacterium]